MVFPPCKIHRNSNSLRRFQVSSARVIPESVRKYALRLRLTPWTWACRSTKRPWSFNPEIARGTLDLAIATALAIPICDSENGTSTEFIKSAKSDKCKRILSCTPGFGFTTI